MMQAPGIAAMVLEHCARRPSDPAVVYEQETLSYGELAERSLRLASALAVFGPNAVVGVFLERSVSSMVAILATWLAGSVYLPLDPLYPRERLAYMLDDAKARVVLTGNSAPDAVAAGRHVATVDGVAVIERNAGAPRAAAGAAYVMFTSGSTGRPKGVTCLHASLHSLFDDYRRRRGPLEPGQAAVLWTSVSFDVSLFEIFMALTTGAVLHVLADDVRFIPETYVETLECLRIGAAYIPAAMLKPFADAAAEQPDRFALRRMLVGAEPVDERQVRRAMATLPGLQVYNGYGATECTIYSSLHAYHAESLMQADVAIGRPIVGEWMHVADERGDPLPPGEIGEIVIGGNGVALGYIDRPALTAERFVPDGRPDAEPGARAYRTGDLGRLRSDGVFVFHGRADRQIKLRGHRIELGEIEAAVRTLDGVADAVLAVRSDAGRERLIAYVTVKPSANVTLQRMQSAVARLLPPTMIPEDLAVVDAIPLTPNGKIDHDALAATPLR